MFNAQAENYSYNKIENLYWLQLKSEKLYAMEFNLVSYFDWQRELNRN